MPLMQEIPMQVHDFGHVNILTGGSVIAHVHKKHLHIYMQGWGLKQHWRERKSRSRVRIPEKQCSGRVCERCLSTWGTAIFLAI